MEQRAHFYTPLTGVCALCEADSPDSKMSGLFCVTSFRTRGCTPCDACASIPAYFAEQVFALTDTQRMLKEAVGSHAGGD